MRLFWAQLVYFLLVTVNTRAIASGSIVSVMVSDTMIALLGFMVIREIADRRGSAAAYVAGSVCGGLLGMIVTRIG